MRYFPTTDGAILQAPPEPISAPQVVPEALPDAWSDETRTALAISVALSKRTGKNLPLATICETVEGAMRARVPERTLDFGPRPCEYTGAQSVKLQVPRVEAEGRPGKAPQVREVAGPSVRMAEAELQTREIQDCAGNISAVKAAAAGHDIKFRIAVDLAGKEVVPAEVVEKVSKALTEVSSKLQLR